MREERINLDPRRAMRGPTLDDVTTPERAWEIEANAEPVVTVVRCGAAAVPVGPDTALDLGAIRRERQADHERALRANEGR